MRRIVANEAHPEIPSKEEQEMFTVRQTRSIDAFEAVLSLNCVVRGLPIGRCWEGMESGDRSSEFSLDGAPRIQAGSL